MRVPPPDARSELAGLALFVAGVVGFVYGIAEHQLTYGNDVASIAVLFTLGIVQLVSAFLLGRWWALLLPVLAVLIAVPAGYPADGRGEPLPTWFTLALLAPVGFVLAALGVGLRRVRAASECSDGTGRSSTGRTCA